MGVSLIGDLQDWSSVFPLRAGENGNGNFFFHEGPLRTAKNCNCNFLYPRRATKDHGELQLQLPFFREGPRRSAKNGNCNGNFLFHEGPLRTAKNCNCKTFIHGGHGGPRRTATATSFFHEGPLRTTKNCNCNTSFFLSAKGREGPRRTATATSFCPRRATKGREERQRQLPFVHGNYLATVFDQPVILGTIRALGDAAGVQAPPCSPAGRLRRRHTVGEGWFCRGALRGRSPCTREGRRPDRPYAKESIEE